MLPHDRRTKGLMVGGSVRRFEEFFEGFLGVGEVRGKDLGFGFGERIVELADFGAPDT